MGRSKFVGGNVKISADQLGAEVAKALEEYNTAVTEMVNEAAMKTAQDTAKTLKSTSPVRSDGYNRKYPPGSYAKSWGFEETAGSMGQKSYTVRNAKHYQLTHLLEHGHIDSKTGRRVGARPHIAAAEQAAIEEFTQQIEKGV